MVAFRRLYKALGLLTLMAAYPALSAAAAPEPVHFVGLYGFTWDGIRLAGAELSIDETADSYSLHLAVNSQGIVNIFTRHRSDTTVSGRRDGNAYHPKVYESHYWTKDKPRHLKLVFNGKGAIIEEIIEPPEDRTLRPEVPHSLKDGSIDPLTLLMAAPRGTGTAFTVFDAKRLWQGTAAKGEPTRIKAYDGSRAALPYSLTRKPVSGLTRKEMLDYLRGEPPLAFYFSDDGRHVPLYMALPIYLGRLSGALLKECKTWEECRMN